MLIWIFPATRNETVCGSVRGRRTRKKATFAFNPLPRVVVIGPCRLDAATVIQYMFLTYFLVSRHNHMHRTPIGRAPMLPHDLNIKKGFQN